MSKEVLKASLRTQVGKNAVKKVRNDHYIPGVLYGHHIESQPISISEHDFDQFYKHHDVGANLTLNVDGKENHVLFKDLQYNSLKNLVVHIEFHALSKGEKIRTKVPIHYINKDTIPAGLIFQELHHEIDMQLLPKDLIESITVDLAGADQNEGLKVEDLEVFKNESIEIFDHPDTQLYTIVEAQVHVEVDEEAEELSPTEVPEIGEEE